MQAGRRVALRHDDLVAIGRRGRDERGQVAVPVTRAGSRPGFDVNCSGRGFDGSRRRCTTCRGEHRCRCGGYQKIQVPHITNLASRSRSARGRVRLTQRSKAFCRSEKVCRASLGLPQVPSARRVETRHAISKATGRREDAKGWLPGFAAPHAPSRNGSVKGDAGVGESGAPPAGPSRLRVFLLHPL
jgi:hypothetical protein